jgi:hypothetical protein
MIINPYNGFLCFGNTTYSGPWLVPGFAQKPVKTLFSVFSRRYGIVAVRHETERQYSEVAINKIATYFDVFTFDAEKPELARWTGKYPDVQAETYIKVLCNGCSIESVERAFWLAHMDIPAPMPSSSNNGHGVCSIGYSKRDGKWYGWSHRAVCGFERGDVVKEGDCTNSSGWTEAYLEDHPEQDLSLPVGFEAKCMADCKRMAIAFAEAVG